jgi:hypothetical protein
MEEKHTLKSKATFIDQIERTVQTRMDQRAHPSMQSDLGQRWCTQDRPKGPLGSHPAKGEEERRPVLIEPVQALPTYLFHVEFPHWFPMSVLDDSPSFAGRNTLWS